MFHIGGGDDAEWRDEVVFDYAQRAMEAQRQLTVIVTGANTGGLMVRNGNLRGRLDDRLRVGGGRGRQGWVALVHCRVYQCSRS